jgi:hypothetical protein
VVTGGKGGGWGGDVIFPHLGISEGKTLTVNDL